MVISNSRRWVLSRSPFWAMRSLLSLAILGSVAAIANAAAPLPPIHHVFIIVLENEGQAVSFGPKSVAPYLAKTLVGQGAYLPDYYAIGHYSLDNYIAMISGQPPNAATQGDCTMFSEFTATGTTQDGIAIGQGCVYPASVKTLADQLEQAGFTWRGYMEDMGNDPAREAATCGHPAIGTKDGTLKAALNDQYATRHDPFVYFHSIIDRPACAANVLPLSPLTADLADPAKTPNLAFITPNLCHDGHDGGSEAKRCVDGEPGGLVSGNAFLEKTVPQILASPAFRKDGLLIVTFDEAETGFEDHDKADATACCGEQPGPNVHPGDVIFRTKSEGAGIVGPGGGQIGAVLVSPFIRPGTVSKTAYNHYALLGSIEDLFGLPHLGMAADPAPRRFGPDIYTETARR